MRVFKYMLLVGTIVIMVSCSSFNEVIGQRISSITSSVTKKNDQKTDEKKESGSSRAMQRFFSKKNKKSKKKESVSQTSENNTYDSFASNGIKTQEDIVETDPNEEINVKAISQQPVDAKATEYRAISDHFNGEWMFENAWGKGVPGEDDRPSIYFDASKGRFYAYNGCNYINGDYRVTGADQLKFDKLISTSEYCADNPQSSEISAVLTNVKYFTLTKLSREEYMELMNDRHQKIGTLHRHLLEALNGLWEVAEIRGNKIVGDVKPTIVIDLPEKRVHGHSGCNLFSGSIYQDPDKELSVQFQGMKVTKKNCKQLEIQTAFLVALEQVEMALLDDDLRAILCDGDGNPLITLTRTE